MRRPELRHIFQCPCPENWLDPPVCLMYNRRVETTKSSEVSDVTVISLAAFGRRVRCSQITLSLLLMLMLLSRCYFQHVSKLPSTRSVAAGFGRHGMPPPAANDTGTALGQDGSD